MISVTTIRVAEVGMPSRKAHQDERRRQMSQIRSGKFEDDGSYTSYTVLVRRDSAAQTDEIFKLANEMWMIRNGRNLSIQSCPNLSIPKFMMGAPNNNSNSKHILEIASTVELRFAQHLLRTQ